MSSRPLFVLASTALIALSLPGAVPVPAEANETSTPVAPPARRYDAAIAYDPVGDQVFVFGGILGDGWPTNETWAHGLSAGADWVPVLQAGPSPQARSEATLSYDSTRGRLVLFGGAYDDVDSGPIYLNDVWVGSTSGSGWTELTPAGTPPPPRAGHVAVYDPAADRLIVFGGTNSITPELGDTWELTFSGTPTWNSIHTSSSPARKRATAVLDAPGSRLLLFGGSAGSTTMNDVWAFSLTNPNKWSAVSSTGTPPPVREGHSAVFDPGARRMLVFGGGPAPYSLTKYNDVWALDLSGSPQWTPLTPSGAPPQARGYHGAVWSVPHGVMVVFGGYLSASPYYANDLWNLDPAGGWSEILPSPDPGRCDMAASFFDPVRDRVVVFGGTADNAYSNSVWAHSPDPDLPWAQITTLGSPPSPRAGASLIYDSGRDRAVLFGGTNGSLMNDVWTLDLGTNAWSTIAPQGTPPNPRFLHSAVYDPVQDRMIVFGGNNGRNDTWELSFSDPPAWNELTPSGSPPSPRTGQSAVLDPARNRMLLFGGGIPGFDSGTYDDDLWALSLSGPPAWTQLTPAGTPPEARMGHTACFDPQGDRMLIFGGGQVLGTFLGPVFNDVWEVLFSGPPAWNELHPGGPLPPRRARQAGGYDSARGELFVFGGWVVTYGATDDAWSLDLGAATTGIETPSPSPGVRLVAAPNPVRSRTALRFTLPSSRLVTLSILDVQGRIVAVPVGHELLPAGEHEISWAPRSQGLGGGVYFYLLEAGSERSAGRLIVLK